VTICFFQNIYFFIFALYCHYNTQKFYEISNSKKPSHFNRLKKTCPNGKFWVENEGKSREKEMYHCPDTVVPKVYSAGSKGSMDIFL
jgi:hypothetical protein